MDSSTGFDLDFSQAKLMLNPPPVVIAESAQIPANLIKGFSAPKGLDKLSGPCALGGVLHFYGIGWNHLPKNKQGIPDNDPFIEEVMRWSEAPDLLTGSMGTSPDRMLSSLRKAGLVGNWYAGSSFEWSLAAICGELVHQRPVIVLTSNSPEGNPMQLKWQVITGFNQESVSILGSQRAHEPQPMPLEEFKARHELALKALSCTFITARKD